MANATVNFTGQVNNAGAQDALFLKVFSGEVMTAFAEGTVTEGRVVTRNIANGKSASFPILGKTTASYHTPGTEITGLQLPANEQIITIDDLLISSLFLSNIDEAKNHYDVRGPYAQEIGNALAYTHDKQILALGVLAARGASPVSGEAAGGSITDAAMLSDTTGAKLIAALFAAAQKMEKFIPAEGRTVYLSPAAYYILAQNSLVQNSLYGAASGGIAEARIPKIAGIELVKTNHAPFGATIAADGAAVAGGPGAGGSPANKYSGVFTNTVGLVLHKAAIGTVKLMDLAMESQYDIRRQGTLMVAKYAMGHGVLRPAAAIQLKTV
jgi:hypothetical protein